LDTEIAFSPGFRWGTTLLPGQMITREDLMAQTAITYPDTAVAHMTGAEIRKTLEQLSDKLFNNDPYQHQGGDMLRTGGLTYTCEPGAGTGARISDLRLNGQPVDADKSYKVARWGVGASPSSTPGAPIWDVVEQHLRRSAPRAVHTPNVPRLIGVENNPGIALDAAAAG
jgi:sulfur-oxidizing protein SoxB